MAQAEWKMKKRGGEAQGKAPKRYTFTGPSSGRPTSGGYTYVGPSASGKAPAKRARYTGVMA